MVIQGQPILRPAFSQIADYPETQFSLLGKIGQLLLGQTLSKTADAQQTCKKSQNYSHYYAPAAGVAAVTASFKDKSGSILLRPAGYLLDASRHKTRQRCPAYTNLIDKSQKLRRIYKKLSKRDAWENLESRKWLPKNSGLNWQSTDIVAFDTDIN